MGTLNTLNAPISYFRAFMKIRLIKMMIVMIPMMSWTDTYQSMLVHPNKGKQDAVEKYVDHVKYRPGILCLQNVAVNIGVMNHVPCIVIIACREAIHAIIVICHFALCGVMVRSIENSV